MSCSGLPASSFRNLTSPKKSRSGAAYNGRTRLIYSLKCCFSRSGKNVRGAALAKLRAANEGEKTPPLLSAAAATGANPTAPEADEADEVADAADADADADAAGT